MQTNVPSGSPQSALVYGAALFAQVQKKTGTFRNMVGPKPTGAEVDAKLSKQQSDPGMPIVEVMDLTKTAGDAARMDCIDVATAKPIMGDRNAEGKGVAMSFSNQDVKIDQWTFPVNAGGRMSQQRTLVHLAGARGQANGADWVIPLQTASGANFTGGDADFADIMINPVMAPTYNRHFVVNGTALTQGGQQLGSIASTDDLSLDHIDQVRNIIDNLDLTLQPVRISDDPAADDEPMWVMLCPPNVYSQLLRDGQLRSFQQNAINRASFGSKHPLFRGEVGMWNGILVKKMSRSIKWLPGDYTKVITSANAATATETSQQINAGLTAGYGVERCVVLGAQALACAYGKDAKSGTHYSWAEKLHNFEREPEFAVFGVEGSTKVRFNVPDESGNKIPTDHGAIVIDVAAKQVG